MNFIPGRLLALIALLICAAILGSAQKPELVVQTGHSNFVDTVAFSPDGTLVASGSLDHSIMLWDTASGQEIRALSGHSKGVKSVVFSPDGKLLASGSEDNTVKLWDVSTGTELRTLNRHSAGVTSVAFSPDGKTLASGGYDTTIKLWNVSTGTELRTLKVPSEWVYSVAFSPDGKVLAGGSGPELSGQELIASLANPKKDDPTHPGHGTINLWDVASGQEIRTLSGHTKDVRTVTFSPDGRLLASGSEDKTVKLWDAASGQEIRTLSGHSKTVEAVAFAPDGKQLASGGLENRIKLWDVATGTENRTFFGKATVLSSIAFSPDGKLLASGNWDKTIDLWDLRTGLKSKTLSGHSSDVFSVAFSPDGKLLANGNQDKTIKLWDTASGQEINALSGHSKFVTSVAFSPDSKLLASGSWDQTIKLWDLAAGQEIKTLSGHTSDVLSVAFSPDGKLLASGSRDETVKLWDVATKQEIRTLSGHSAFVTSVAFSPDGKLLASGSWDKTIKLWDVARGQEIRTLAGNENLVDSVAFSPDGKLLASGGGGGEGTINLWDTATGQVIRTLRGHSTAVSSLTFSPDGKLLASGSGDQTVKLWDPVSGREIKTLSGHSGFVRSVAFSPNGKLLMSGSSDTKIKVWEISSGTELASLIALDEKDWIVVTPDGLFDGSPVAWSKILWRFNNNTFNYAAVEAFFSDFYYPGLLTDVLEGKRIRAGKQISQKDRRQPQLKLSYLPPKTEDKPKNAGDKVTDDDLKRIWEQIKARAAQQVGGAINITKRETTIKIDIPEAAGGAQDVRLFRNGSLVKVWHGDVLKGQSSVTLEATISVVAGENRLTAYAFNHDNIKSSDATLRINGAESLKRKGVAYILAAGVNEYANANYNLKYAVADAQDFADELKLQQEKLNNYERVEVVSLKNGDATKANIFKALADFSGKIQPEDALVIFFAGHGTAQLNHFYLIPHDLGYAGSRTELDSAALQGILSHSISDEEIERAVEGIDAAQLLLVIDACNSGQALEAEEKRRGPMNSKGLAQLAYEKGMYILTAAQSYQAAQEAARLGHGFLTFALVEEGLKTSLADKEPNDGQVLLREWLDFATQRVPQMQQDELDEQKNRQLERIKFAEADSGKERSIQRPRVFYRRETESQPLVVAKP